MSILVFLKLLAIFVVVAIGWLVGKLKWLGANDPARTLSNAAYYIFVPALLFRTTSRLDLMSMPWRILIAVFVPLSLLLLAVYFWQKSLHRGAAGDEATGGEAGPRSVLPVAGPSVRALAASFGNTVQVGIPMAAALFGERGLAVHLAIISLHSLTLLTLATALVELDLAHAERRAGNSEARLLDTLLTTARNTLIHPVVLPVLAGLAWNALGLPMPLVADEILQTLGQAVVPLCLVLIGMSLAYYGIGGALRGAIGFSILKLLVAPTLVLAFAHWGLGLNGLPLAVLVMMAALPTGSNALIFAQRYRALEGETTTATVFSTLAFVVTAPLWLAVLAALG